MTSEDRQELRYQRRKAKRIKDQPDFSELLKSENLYNSYKLCRKGTSWKAAVQRYGKHCIRNIFASIEKLKKGEPITEPFNLFEVQERGRIRVVMSVRIKERVVQKALHDYILFPILKPTLIPDSGACIKGKGISFTRKRLKEHLRRFYRKTENNEGYVLCIDYSNYFGSIRHDVLLEFLSKKIRDERTLKLVKEILDNYKEIGLGLGSQISQLCALFYISSLDHFVKEKLRVKYYGRYMDDCYLISDSKEELKYWLKEIRKFSESILGLTISSRKTTIQKLTNFKFIKGHYCLTSTGRIKVFPDKKTFLRFKHKFVKMLKMKCSKEILLPVVQSWKGHLKYFNSWKEKQAMSKLLGAYLIKSD